MASRAILSNFCEEEGTQNHPQYLSGLSRALFPTTFPEIAVNVFLSLFVLARGTLKFVLNWIHNFYEVARAHADYGLSYK